MKLPNKYKSPGLHIWCNECKKVVTKNPCSGHKLVFQSRIWNPKTKKTNCIKSWPGLKASEAFQAHLKFRSELETNEYYYMPAARVESPKARTLSEAKRLYFDYLSNVGVPIYAQKERTTRYVKEQEGYIERFLDVIKNNGVNPSNIHPQISNEMTEWFYNWLESREYSNRTYNHHINAVKMWFAYLQKEKIIEFNAFSKVKNKFTATDSEIILDEELEQLFKLVTHENGFKKVGKERKNYYREWLVTGFKLALYTGERRDGVVLLKGKHIEENYIKVPNWKRNKAKMVEDFSYVPITEDIARFLITLDTQPDSYLIAPHMHNRSTVKQLLSKSFGHYWSLMNNPKQVSFKNLRKTFETRMWMLLGDKVKGLKRHKSLTTKVEHYLSQKEIIRELVGKEMFDLSARYD